MPSAQTFINLSLADLGTIRTGETVSSAISNDCLARLNMRVAAHSIEQMMVQTLTHRPFNLVANTSRYTVGAGGAFDTTVRAEKIVSWRATNGAYTSGGAPLLYGAFEAAAQQAYLAAANAISQVTALQAEMAAKVTSLVSPFMLAPAYTFPTILLAQAAVPMFVAADATSPLINLEVFPTPAAAPGSLLLAYYTALTQFADLTTVYTFPDGWDDFLHYDLAIALLPRYGRQGFNPEALIKNAQLAKEKIAALNGAQQAPPQ